MKVLAEYVMAGPKQAAFFCLVFGFLPIIGPWLSGAAIALVVLHLGIQQALKVIPWALLPGLVWLSLGDSSYISLLFIVVISALVLHASRSLNKAVLSAVFLSAITFLSLQMLVPDNMERVNKVMIEAFSKTPEMESLLDNNEASSVAKSKESLIALLTHMAFAWAATLTPVLVLLLGRWWQSLLYKPGAFQKEFHHFRLSFSDVVLLTLAIFVSMQGIGVFNFENAMLSDEQIGIALAPVFSIPIMLSGIALVHALIAIASLSVHWLGFFYVSLFFIGHIIYLPLIIAALLDVVMDFRSRLSRAGKN